MKIKSFKIEILLLAVPILLLIIQQLFFKDTTFDVHLHDTMFVISAFYVLAGIFFVQALYFFMHRELRSAKNRNVYICSTHVMAVSFFLLLIFVPVFIFSQPPQKDSPYNYIRFALLRDRFDRVAAFSVIAFVLFHVLFLFYFFILVIKKFLVSK